METVQLDLECAVLLCKSLNFKFFLTYWHFSRYFVYIFEFHYLQIECMWEQCQSKHHIHSESKLSDCIHYNWNLCIFGYSRFIRYILLTTRAEMVPNLIWAPRNLGSKNLVTKKFGPREKWSPRNLSPHEFHYMSFSCRDLISFGPYFSGVIVLL